MSMQERPQETMTDAELEAWGDVWAVTRYGPDVPEYIEIPDGEGDAEDFDATVKWLKDNKEAIAENSRRLTAYLEQRDRWRAVKVESDRAAAKQKALETARAKDIAAIERAVAEDAARELIDAELAKQQEELAAEQQVTASSFVAILDSKLKGTLP